MDYIEKSGYSRVAVIPITFFFFSYIYSFQLQLIVFLLHFRVLISDRLAFGLSSIQNLVSDLPHAFNFNQLVSA